MLSRKLVGLVLVLSGSIAPAFPAEGLEAVAPGLAQVGQEVKVEARRLLEQGIQQYQTKDYPAAIQSLEKALTIYRTLDNRHSEATALLNLGVTYRALSQSEKAIDYYTQALPIFQALNDPNGEADTLLNLGSAYRALSQYQKAIDYYTQALSIYQAIPDRNGEAKALNSLGITYGARAQYEKAIDYYTQALPIYQAVQDRNGEAKALMNLAIAYQSLSQYEKAIDYHTQALSIYQAIPDRNGEATALMNLAIAYHSLSQYEKAIDYHTQALSIYQAIPDRNGEATALMNLADVYRSFSQYEKAISYYNQALDLQQTVNDRNEKAGALMKLGSAFLSLSQPKKAIDYHTQALSIYQAIQDHHGEATALANLGSAYASLSKYEKAIDYHTQALPIFQAVQDRHGEATALNNLGLAYAFLSKYDQAISYYTQALPIFQTIKDRSGEGKLFNNLGVLFTKRNELELAIVFYKQSVSVRETIRVGLRKLPRDSQESYTQSIAGTYRALADLLLKQNRILEAQQILDLLKVQELNDYLTNVRGESKPLTVLPPETEILKKYGELQKSAIELGQEFNQLEDLARTGTLTPDQRDRKNQLLKLQQELNQQFNQFTQRSDVVALTNQLTPTAIKHGVSLDQLDSLRDELRRLNAVMIYPLILDDRLELIITTPDSPPLRRTTTVKREDLNRAIAEFRQALQDPTQDAKPIAQKLYTWIIQPLEADLKQANAKTIIYAPDAQLRYIPLAALHDGQQWLVHRFRINNITAQSLTNFTHKPQTRSRVLAGASAAAHEITVGNKRQSFRALPFAAQEVNNVATLLPNTTKLINQNFSLEGFTAQMNEYAIVHFATHASFVPEDPTQSFILFGDGKTANLQQIGNWTLKDVDLVVLSACETAVGIQALGSKALGRGEEILGLGYQFQSRGAKATIASLWSVDDGGTQALISAFYQQLQSGKLTKAEALQQAQIVLLNTKTKAAPIPSDRAVVQPETPNQPTRNDQISPGYSHPYYWAPFILIGNGL